MTVASFVTADYWVRIDAVLSAANLLAATCRHMAQAHKSLAGPRLIENSGTAPPTPTTQVYAVGELGK
jgi:hypothetical protein